MKKFAALAIFLCCFSLGYSTPAISAEDGWTTWWSGPYTDGLMRSDFTTTRPVAIRVFYRNSETWDWFIPTSSFFDGEYNVWELIINANHFEYFESGYGDWVFNRIDVM